MYPRISLSLSLLALPTGASYAADSTSFNPVPIAIAAQGAGVPVGTVVTWTQSALPSGTDAGKWLECNGQSTAGYPELAAVVGPIVPDYRGLFLRGTGGNAAHLGVEQGDAIRNITGQVGTGGLVGIGGSGVFHPIGTSSVQITSGVYNHYSNYWAQFDASRQVPTAEENRPKNKAVKYIMKARP